MYLFKNYSCLVSLTLFLFVPFELCGIVIRSAVTGSNWCQEWQLWVMKSCRHFIVSEEIINVSTIDSVV